MSNRDVAIVALGRFLAVERYRETSLPSWTTRLPDPGAAVGEARRGTHEFPASRYGRRHPDLRS
jgi:hypothetical protein